MSWAAVLLLIGVLAIVWPARPVRIRLRRPPLSRPFGLPARVVGGGPALGDQRGEPEATTGWWPAVVALAARRPRRVLLSSIGGVAAAGLLAGGPVAGVVAAVYAGLAGRALLRRSVRRRAAVVRSAVLDELAALAADLRAGLPPVEAGRRGSVDDDRATAGHRDAAPADRTAHLTSSVWRLAERTGAPAADLVERIEADARAADRAAAAAAAQAAGAQATALLLAGLPVGGIGLGIAIGADPVRVLLHTPIGAACAVAAVLLQCGGMLWADRLVAGVAR
jgi:tight adherence protein B